MGTHSHFTVVCQICKIAGPEWPASKPLEKPLLQKAKKNAAPKCRQAETSEMRGFASGEQRGQGVKLTIFCVVCIVCVIRVVRRRRGILSALIPRGRGNQLLPLGMRFN